MKTTLLNKITNSELVNKHIHKAIKDDAFAAKTLVTLNVAKDIFGEKDDSGMNNGWVIRSTNPIVLHRMWTMLGA